MTLSIAEFETLLDTHGPWLNRWPEALSLSARVLLAESEEARRVLSAAHAVDAALASPDTRTPAGLADRIVDRALGKRDTD